MISHLARLFAEASGVVRIIVIVVVIGGLHLAVTAVRHLSNRFKSFALSFVPGQVAEHPLRRCSNKKSYMFSRHLTPIIKTGW
jgi:hypothetical protein